VGYVSYGQLISCGKIICAKIRALTKYIVWQYTLAGYAFWGRLRSHGKIILCAKIRALNILCGNIPWRVTLFGAEYEAMEK